MDCNGDCVLDCVLAILFAYYAWGLSYPKQYQIFGFLQCYLLDNKEDEFFKSTKYITFDKKYSELDQ